MSETTISVSSPSQDDPDRISKGTDVDSISESVKSKNLDDQLVENRENAKKTSDQRNQRRGSTSGTALPRHRGKPERHFSLGGESLDDFSKKSRSKNFFEERRFSLDTKKLKKSGDASTPPHFGSKGHRLSSSRYHGSLSDAHNGSGDFDYYTDEYELEEPFSESDEEEAQEARRRRQAKPQLLLPMPRRRIRTLSGTIPSVGYSPVWGGPTMCLGCLEFFDLPRQTLFYVDHLLEKHKIVIADIELIVDLKRYVEHWRHRFGRDKIENIFPIVEPLEGDSLYGKVDKYHFICEKVADDRGIREKLALRRLEEVLQCQQRERMDRSFRRQCLFCRYRAPGNRAKLIHHLYTIHHLNLGSPDNLVFINEYIDVLEGKMKKNECIYCENEFPDHQQLTEHMRRKSHREVNPKNHYYDKFYVINYLELGKRWLDVLAEDFEDKTPAFIDSDEEEEEETWNEWEDDLGEESEVSALCLFCEDAFTEAPLLLQHMKDKHNYDFIQVIADEGLDFYGCVKMVNYIRKQNYNLVCFVCGKDDLHPRSALIEHLQNENHMSAKLDKTKWDKDEYLIPTFDNDHFLLFIGEIVDVHNDDDEEEVFQTVSASGERPEPKLSSIYVIPEDMPELENTVLGDPDLRDQLK